MVLLSSVGISSPNVCDSEGSEPALTGCTHIRDTARCWRLDLHRSEAAGVGDRLGEGLGGFLGQVVPDAAGDGPACSALGGKGAWLAAWLSISSPLTETSAVQRSGHSAATT